MNEQRTSDKCEEKVASATCVDTNNEWGTEKYTSSQIRNMSCHDKST